ncbi:MAG: sugar ABC transporter permease [Gammaproteobacteria bacterium]|nr:sugar ABC transporter permease [Gammaproteobacteria bacterium]
MAVVEHRSAAALVRPPSRPILRGMKNFAGPDLDGYWFVMPAAFIMVALIVYPFCLAVYFSLSDAFIGHESQFIGLENFVYIIQNDDIFWRTVRNTLLFAFFSVTSKIVLGMMAALLLLKATRFKKFWRGSMLIPFVAPTALTTLGWWLIFDPTYSHVNWILENVWPFYALGIGPYHWLGDPNLALAACIFVNIWRGLPFFIITILAGLVSIPQYLYEAAEIDGASAWQQFWKITVPLLRPILAIVILFSTIFTLADFNIVFVLTRGGPMNSTHLFATYSYVTGISNHEIGLGAAISLFLFPILVAIVIFLLRLVRRDTSYEL